MGDCVGAVMARCEVTSIAGRRCVLDAGHQVDLLHDYESHDYESVTAVIAERDRARTDLAVLRTHLAMDAKHADENHEQRSSAFWYTMWTEGNRRNAEIVLELARERERTAGMLGAEAFPRAHAIAKVEEFAKLLAIDRPWIDAWLLHADPLDFGSLAILSTSPRRTGP